jgi:hypothetical protein
MTIKRNDKFCGFHLTAGYHGEGTTATGQIEQNEKRFMRKSQKRVLCHTLLCYKLCFYVLRRKVARIDRLHPAYLSFLRPQLPFPSSPVCFGTSSRPQPTSLLPFQFRCTPSMFTVARFGADEVSPPHLLICFSFCFLLGVSCMHACKRAQAFFGILPSPPSPLS